MIANPILIVDDDKSLRETIADLLEMAGFRPVTASNAVEALVILQQEPRVAALITDLSMPGVDGVTLIHQARKIRPDLPALLLTGYAEQPVFAAGEDGNSFRVLRKPVESYRLIEQLEALVANLGTPVYPGHEAQASS